jgi:hypothetical protein
MRNISMSLQKFANIGTGTKCKDVVKINNKKSLETTRLP